jgi:hypothetical protein
MSGTTTQSESKRLVALVVRMVLVPMAMVLLGIAVILSPYCGM